MKVAEFENEKIVVKERENLKLTEKGAIVKVHGCGLCGSDIVKYRQNSVPAGTVLGHEIVGEIVEINSDSKFKKGDKIVSSHHIPCFSCDYCRNGNYSMCNHFKKTNIVPGGFSEYVYLSEEHLKNVAQKIPNNLSEVEVSFYEPLACCLRAINRGAVDYANKKCLVVGLGSIGLLFGQAVAARNAIVEGCDIIDERINTAEKFGIKSFNSENIEHQKYDIVFLTAGADATLKVGLDAVRNGGTIVVFASTPNNSGFANNEIYHREITILGSYSPSPNELRDSIALLKSKQVKVDGISTEYDLENIECAIQDTIQNKIFKAYIKIG